MSLNAVLVFAITLAIIGARCAETLALTRAKLIDGTRANPAWDTVVIVEGEAAIERPQTLRQDLPAVNDQRRRRTE